VFNLGLLALLKYAGFLLRSLGSLLEAAGVAAPAAPDIVLPIGILPYTFMTIPYVLDVYRGRSAPARSPSITRCM
jgi:alginate O-acetyltransferase complex protein AlgI